MSRKLYIADTHFGHANILRYDNRPWLNVGQMDEDMVDNWNTAVDRDDDVFILGDVVWSKSKSRWVEVLEQLHGRKYIVKGNHDRPEVLAYLQDEGIITGWSDQLTVVDDGRDVVLNHSPMPFFINCHNSAWYHLYGHVHISFDNQVIKHVRMQLEELYQHPMRMYNVGCMIPGMKYAPKTLDEIIEIDRVNRERELFG